MPFTGSSASQANKHLRSVYIVASRAMHSVRVDQALNPFRCVLLSASQKHDIVGFETRTPTFVSCDGTARLLYDSHITVRHLYDGHLWVCSILTVFEDWTKY